ncbi:hypothetical protein QYE76_055241 [Lolium multiflorum]|uniref:CCHC-type domain-containing protein n=1 Tax=Lolium multiflorum TaxID=4521 RepID=A0AAD8T033_LOLMU|nr:hypothetical protein QYE76_055241 [Lolium multiflorum]
MMRATEFQELVDAAITLEDDFKQLQEEKRKKAKFEPKRFVSNKPNTNLSFKPRYNNTNNNNSNYYNSRRNQAFQTANQIVCRSCGGKGHFSKDCKKPRIICFGCREEGHMLRDCPKRKNGGDLFILPMKDIDVILGMNWLEENGALIDCTQKTVSLKNSGGDRIIYQGDKHTQIEVELKLNSMKEVKLEDIPVVNEFQDVFPAELPGYYRRFIEGFSKIAGPMTKLLRKNTPFVWSDECEKSFQTLKEKLTTAPVLAVPEDGKDYTVY